VLLQVLELGVVSRRNLLHFLEENIDDIEVGIQVALPGGQVHVGQLNRDLA
jgi:hypothetical protein